MPEQLSPQDIDHALQKLPGWSVRDEELCADYSFADFNAAFAFMVRVAMKAEAVDHHPRWSNIYNKVSIAFSTHSAGHKITELDLEMARFICAIASDVV